MSLRKEASLNFQGNPNLPILNRCKNSIVVEVFHANLPKTPSGRFEVSGANCLALQAHGRIGVDDPAFNRHIAASYRIGSLQFLLKCLDMISTDEVIRRIESYFVGGAIENCK